MLRYLSYFSILPLQRNAAAALLLPPLLFVWLFVRFARMVERGWLEEYVSLATDVLAEHESEANDKQQAQLQRASASLRAWLNSSNALQAPSELQVHHHSISMLLRTVAETLPRLGRERIQAAVASKWSRALELVEQIAFGERSLRSRSASKPTTEGPRPIFVVSSWRSGTTLLMSILDAHKNLTALPENTVLDPFLGVLTSPFANNGPLLMRNRPLIIEAFNCSFPLGLTESQFYRQFALFIDGLVTPYVKTYGGQRWVYKETSNTDALALIDLAFGYQARFIWLVRHALDVVNSHIERYERRGIQRADVADYARDWADKNQFAADFCDRTPERCLKVRYEDLVSAPQSEVNRILDFVGEPWDDKLFECMESSFNRLGGDHKITATGGKIDATRRGRWAEWPPVYIKQLAAIVNPMLRRAGYAPVE